MEATAAFSRDYSNVVTLNNIGVTLLERKALRDALETFQDAITSMNLTLLSAATRAPRNPSQAIQSRLSKAIKRLQCPHSVPTGAESNMIMNDHSRLSTVLEVSTTHFCIFPVRIDEDNLLDYDFIDERDLDMDSAIMIYNFGIAHYYSSKLNKSTEMQRGALKLFQFAYSLICDKDSQLQVSEGALQHASKTRLVLASTFLNGTIQILGELGMYSEAGDSYQQLTRLGRLIRYMEQTESLIYSVCAAAA